MPEHQNIEYKQSWRDEYLKWICGFANAQGGKIFIGLDDNGRMVGLIDSKALLEEIPNKIVSHLGLVIDVNLRKKSGKHYIEIDVPVSDVPISYHGAYYYRSGSTKQELKGSALHEFLLKKIGNSWDDVAHPKATIKDIDPSAEQSFRKKGVESGRISKEAIQDTDTVSLLTKLHLITEEGKIKNAALLLFGKDPLKYFTTAYFKIGRFGKSHADLKFQDVVEGNILDMADKVLNILRTKYLTSPIRYEGLQRIEELEYPVEALREAILNSIVHKDYTDSTIQLSVYDDKLILWNPGKLPYNLTIEQLKDKHSSKARNKNIAEIFFKAGYIEAWGRGISKIMDACRNAGLPEPIIEEKDGGVRLTFLKDVYTEEFLSNLGLEERFVKAILFIKEEGSITNAKFQELFSVSKRTATSDLQLLMEKELIKKIGTTGRGTFYVLQRGNKGAKGAIADENDDLDLKLQALEKDLEHINPNEEVKWQLNEKVFFEIYDSWLSLLLIGIIQVAQKFNSLFNVPKHHIFIMQSIGSISFVNENPNEIVSKLKEDSIKNNRQIFDRLVVQVALNYSTFRKGGTKTFGCNYSVEIIFDVTTYSIFIDEFVPDSEQRNRVIQFEPRLLHQKVTNEEIKTIAKKFGENIYKHIDYNTKKQGLRKGQ